MKSMLQSYNTRLMAYLHVQSTIGKRTSGALALGLNASMRHTSYGIRKTILQCTDRRQSHETVDPCNSHCHRLSTARAQHNKEFRKPETSESQKLWVIRSKNGVCTQPQPNPHLPAYLQFTHIHHSWHKESCIGPEQASICFVTARAATLVE